MIPNVISGNLCKRIHDIINYPTSICPFQSGKCGKKGKKIQKCDEKRFLDEIKTFFIVCEGLSFSEKVQI